MFGKDFINSNPTPITTNIIKKDKTITYGKQSFPQFYFIKKLYYNISNKKTNRKEVKRTKFV